MKRDGLSQDLLIARTCAGAQANALELIDQQQYKEPSTITRARFSQVSGLAQAATVLAEGVSDEFCKAHCRPSWCTAKTGETIVELNQRVLLRAGTNGKEELVQALKDSDSHQPTPSLNESDCPYLEGQMPLDTLLEDLLRGVDPEVLEAIGFGNETPASLSGGYLISDEPMAHYLDPNIIP